MTRLPVTYSILLALLLTSLLCLSTDSSAAGLESDVEILSKTQIEVSPQFVYLKSGSIAIQAYGAEFGAWYRIAENWDIGASLRQVYSLKNGGSAIISALSMKARWHIIGGRLPSIKKWKNAGATSVVQDLPLEGGLHLDSSIEQATFNTSSGSRSFSGFGILSGYTIPVGRSQAVDLGLGASRISNGTLVLNPLRLTLSWQSFF